MDYLQPEISQHLLKFPSRPKRSANFNATPVSLISNHFTVSLPPKNDKIHIYHLKILDIEKDEQLPGDARIQRQRIMRSAMSQLKEIFKERFEYSGEVLWSSEKYNEAKNIQTEVSKKIFLISVTWKREMSLRPETLQDSLIAGITIQYINILGKKYFKEKGWKEWGLNAKFYDLHNFVDMKNFHLLIYKGFKTSCQTYQKHVPKMLIDYSCRIVRGDSALDFIVTEKSTQKARELLQGKTVIASYGNQKMWRVDDVDFQRNPRTEVDIQGTKMSLAKYFWQKYGIKVRDMNQPVLVSKNRRTEEEMLLLPELVHMTGLSEEMRQNSELMKEVARHTRLSPVDRMQRIVSQRRELQDFLNTKYEIQMEAQSFVQGYHLKAPKLTFGEAEPLIPDRGNYTLKSPVKQPAVFKEWLFVYHESCQKEAEKFVEMLMKCSGTFAIKVHQPKMVCLKDRRVTVFAEVIKSNIKNNTQIIVAMYPEIAKKPWYKALKDVCYKEKGVPCQAVIAGTINNKNTMSVCSKILLQMQAKIGMPLWATEIPKGLPENTMIIGADVFHSTKIGEEKKSCIGFCASLDREFTRFFSKVTFQNKVGEEIMASIGDLVVKAVKEYFVFNGKKFLPECIIFYRDGVGESQLKAVLEFETDLIIKKLKSLDQNYDFKFAEIIVTKRINDRIFTAEGGSGVRQQGGRGGAGPQGCSNPAAGTVVGEGIVSNNFDFLLASQNVNQGTCTPTHYNVIYDNTGLPEDLFWQLTYNQCYNYYNWNGSVKVPAPVQYAHKLAYLAGQTIQGEVKSELDKSLYYL